jgi:hypothetical protein
LEWNILELLELLDVEGEELSSADFSQPSGETESVTRLLVKTIMDIMDAMEVNTHIPCKKPIHV